MENKESQTAFPFEGEKSRDLGVCSSKKNYIGETKRNVITRWNEHESPNKDSEPVKHLFQHPDHVFHWKVLMSTTMNICKRKNPEAFFIAVKHSTLNEQKDSKELTLFRNCVT